MGIDGFFLRQPFRLSGIRIDQDFDLHDTENPDVLHKLVTRYVDPPPVTHPIDPFPPIADFDAAPLTGLAPLTVQFRDRTINNPTLWRWYFAPEYFPIEGGPNPIHVFEDPGTYTVGLYVSNPYGEHAIDKVDYITVTAVPPPPPANLFRDPGFESGIWYNWVPGGYYEGGHDVEIGTPYKRTGSYGAMLATNHGHELNDSVYFSQILGYVRVDSIEFYYSIKNVPAEGGYAELVVEEWPSLVFHRYPIPNAVCNFTKFHQDGPWIGSPMHNIIFVYIMAYGFGHQSPPATDQFRAWFDDFYAPPHT